MAYNFSLDWHYRKKLDPFHILSFRQAEEEYSKLKLRLEAIKRSQEEAAAKVALENKEAAKITPR